MSVDEGHVIEDVTCVGETAKAIQITTVDGPDGQTMLWVPKSQIHDNSQVYKNGQEGDICVSSWWARQKGFLE